MRLFRVLGALLVGMVVGWIYSLKVYKILEKIVEENIPDGIDYTPIITTITGSFMLQLKMAFYIGLFMTLPFIVFQIWGFIGPGLRPTERKPLKIIAPVSVVLFFAGAAMCWSILPITVTWFANFMFSFPDTKLMLEAGTMVFFLVKMVLSFGIGFQMPIIVFVLAYLEIVTPKAMMKYWRHAILFVVVASAMITPSGDPFTLALMSVPLIALFFISVAAAQWTIKKKKGRDDELDDLD